MKFSRVSTAFVSALVLSIAAVTTAQTLTEKLLRVAGFTAGPAPARSTDGAAVPGNIWVATTDKNISKALTTDGGYTSPIFSPDGRVYALRGGAAVRLPQETGAGVAVHKVPGVVKLVGFDEPPKSSGPGGMMAGVTGFRYLSLAFDDVAAMQQRCMDDGWTVRTQDGRLSTHVEHTICVTENGPEVFTVP